MHNASWRDWGTDWLDPAIAGRGSWIADARFEKYRLWWYKLQNMLQFLFTWPFGRDTTGRFELKSWDAAFLDQVRPYHTWFSTEEALNSRPSRPMVPFLGCWLLLAASSHYVLDTGHRVINQHWPTFSSNATPCMHAHDHLQRIWPWFRVSAYICAQPPGNTTDPAIQENLMPRTIFFVASAIEFTIAKLSPLTYPASFKFPRMAGFGYCWKLQASKECHPGSTAAICWDFTITRISRHVRLFIVTRGVKML